jgi:hypothetical protein
MELFPGFDARTSAAGFQDEEEAVEAVKYCLRGRSRYITYLVRIILGVESRSVFPHGPKKGRRFVEYFALKA